MILESNSLLCVRGRRSLDQQSQRSQLNTENYIKNYLLPGWLVLAGACLDIIITKCEVAGCLSLSCD